MKKIYKLLFILFSTFIIFGCNFENPSDKIAREELEQKIVGMWSDNPSFTTIFRSNHEYYFVFKIYSVERGEWEIKKHKDTGKLYLDVHIDGRFEGDTTEYKDLKSLPYDDVDKNWRYFISFDEDDLILNSFNGSKSVLKRKE